MDRSRVSKEDWKGLIDQEYLRRIEKDGFTEFTEFTW